MSSPRRKTMGDAELEAADALAPGCDVCGAPYVIASAGHLPVVAMVYPQGRDRRGVSLILHPGERPRRECAEHSEWFQSRLRGQRMAAE